MIEWLSANISTVITVAVLLGILALIIFYMIKNKKKGKSSCGCNCTGCTSSCNQKNKPK